MDDLNCTSEQRLKGAVSLLRDEAYQCVPYTALIDVGSTHSYVACTVTENLGILVENTSSGITILSLLGQSIKVNKLFRDVPLEIQGVIFPIDLMELSFGEFNLILGMDSAKKLICKGCEAFLAYISVLEVGKCSVKDIRTVKDFPDVFLEELPGLPLERAIEFGIELLPGIAPVSITPYRMAPKELVELKAQI
ncbi:uncharacterized protein LOC128290586 [Gossypium arboreum]|uniref:uncharacterized protein LOC128290586 n=1 Tax=Gossypium arboreum TaxID=29729 RepID=UPI0022F15F2D|nr:uncharacterized protein LOC128290586 [Gossypium arboreum]